MSEESTLSFRGLCRYIHRLSKASKAGMKAALADCPKRHFPMLEGLLGCIRLHGQDGAVYISDLVQELHQPLPAISRTVRQMEQDGLVERFADPADRRRTLLRCTEKACPIIEQGRALQEEFGARLLEHTNEAQRKAFFETMDIINENLDAILEGEA